MSNRSEELIASAKAGLTNVRNSLASAPAHWQNCSSAVRTCMSYIDESRLMQASRRLDEKLWILNEVQNFAYFDADNGGVADVATWCEREWNRIIAGDPYNVGALTGLGEAWLAKAQYWLARIDREHGDDDDEKLRHTASYVEARALLMPAVDFLARAVDNATSQRRLTGHLLAKRAEASMSLGNVSQSRAARQHIAEAVQSLDAASRIPGYRLPRHLAQYLRDNEYVLRG